MIIRTSPRLPAGSYPITVTAVSTSGKVSATYVLRVIRLVSDPHAVTVQVQDIYGQPLGGVSVTLTINGTSLSAVTKSSGTATFAPIPEERNRSALLQGVSLLWFETLISVSHDALIAIGLQGYANRTDDTQHRA